MKLALTLPGGSGGFAISPPPHFNNQLKDLGSVFSGVANIAFLIAGFLLVFWFSWGVFEYLFAGGDKAGLEKARKRITWAIVGFFITMLAFAISQFAQQIFPQSLNSVQNVTAPAP